MSKKVLTVIKINLQGGAATPAQPLGPALGQHGVPIMDFVRAYNDKTAEFKGQIIPAVITIYEDRSFEFEIKKAPASDFIKKELGLDKGSGETPRTIVGKLSMEQIERIAKEKMDDLNTTDIEAAKKIIAGTAKSMGVEIKK